MAKVLSFANNKGGVAKTTTCTNTAMAFALIEDQRRTDGRILVIDTDSQGHSGLLMTGENRVSDERALSGLLQAMTNNAPPNVIDEMVSESIVQSNWSHRIDVLRAGKKLEVVEKNLVGHDGNVFMLDDLIRLYLDDYEYIMIDTSPKLSLLTTMAALASHDVIIPVSPGYLDADGLINLIQSIQKFRVSWRHDRPEISGVVITKKHHTITAHREFEDDVSQHNLLGPIFLGHIPLNAAVEYSQNNKESVFAYSPNSKAAVAYGDFAVKLYRKTAS